MDAPESALKADDNVVTISVAPRLGDGEAQVCSFAHKSKLGKFATAFAAEVAGMSQFIRLILIGH